jgi:hypothetical protein
MEARLSQERIAPAIAAFAVGIAVSSLIQTPFGLLAPALAIFLFAGGRAGLALHAVSAAGLIGSLFVVVLHEGEARDIATTWAAFFALAICIGALVATRGSASPRAVTRPAAMQGAAREQAPSYPAVGPSLDEKAAPRNSPVVSLTAEDDQSTATQLVAVSFWGGLPFHLRYWRRQPDGRYRWVESRSEPLPEPSGTRYWRAVSAEIDDQSSAEALPTRMAANPPSDDDAVRAAKIVEDLLGNAWAFDAAGRPTYLTPLAQTLVAVTLEDFQTAVDEGHTFFKRTAHPDDYDRISESWLRSLQTGEPFFLDRRIQRASGIHEWNRTGFVPTRDGQGRITGWYGSTIDLDSHRIAQAELRDRERELSQLVDMVPSHIWRLTSGGELVFFNKRMVDFLGFDIADADTRGVRRLDAVLEAIHPDDAVKFKDALTGCLATGDAFAMRYRLRRTDGVYRWMSSRAEPLRDDVGGIVQWYGICHDIDDQVRLYSELEDREAKIRRLVDSDVIGIVFWDLNGTLIDANDAFLRMVQYDREDLKAGLDWFAMTPPEWQEVHAREEAEELARTGKMQAREKEYFRKDGSRVPILIGAACFEGVSNQGVAYILDLTEQKRVEAALRIREGELQEIIDAVPVRIWRATPNDGPAYFNKRYQDHFRSVITDFDAVDQPRIGALLQELVHPDEAPGVERALASAFENGDGAVLRFRWREKDGVYRWAECRVEPRRDSDGAIVQWYGASVDIDDEMRAQAELRRTQERLAQASQAASLAELSASIAHEVNQPLAAVVANSHACQRWLTADPPNLERAQSTVERIIRDANGAADVVARIRALFKQSVIARSGSSLSAVIADAERSVSDLAMRNGVVIDVRVEPGVPPVAVDQVQIQQVLINLMRNAVEAMTASKGDKALSVRASKDGDAIRIEVRDTGPGIEDAEKIFDAFFTTKESGMGMGLAVSRSIVESHGGRLWAEQSNDGGASFTFVLPIDASVSA